MLDEDLKIYIKNDININDFKGRKKQINEVRKSIQGIDEKSVTQKSRSATWRGNSSREL